MGGNLQLPMDRTRTTGGKFAPEADPLLGVALRLRQSTIDALNEQATKQNTSISQLMRSYIEAGMAGVK